MTRLGKPAGTGGDSFGDKMEGSAQQEKSKTKGQVTIPKKRRRIVITPKMAIDQFSIPTADEEYTPAQRRIIDARLVMADADTEAGRVSKAFSDDGEFIAALHAEAARLSAKKPKRQEK